jgi:hypothetical protein
MPKWLVVDCETRIDTSLINRVNYPHDHLTDADAYQRFRQRMFDQSNQRSDFIPWAYHVPISIAAGAVEADYTLSSVVNLGRDELSRERSLIDDFWRIVNQGATLVTWGGNRFDMRVMEAHALKHGISAKAYWSGKARYRFGEEGHLDLMDLITNYGATDNPGLNLYAKFLEYHGKTETDGGMVQQLWESGQQVKIDTYCCQDVINTYLVFIRLQLARGLLTYERFALVERDALARLAALDEPVSEELPF